MGSAYFVLVLLRFIGMSVRANSGGMTCVFMWDSSSNIIS
jgi:hypothetical protein